MVVRRRNASMRSCSTDRLVFRIASTSGGFLRMINGKTSSAPFRVTRTSHLNVSRENPPGMGCNSSISICVMLGSTLFINANMACSIGNPPPSAVPQGMTITNDCQTDQHVGAPLFTVERSHVQEQREFHPCQAGSTPCVRLRQASVALLSRVSLLV